MQSGPSARPALPPWAGAAFGAALVAGVGLLLHVFRVGLGLMEWSYDLPFAARPVTRPTEALLVYMDDAAHARLGQPLNAPWDRRLHARLIDRLTAAGARAVVFDIIFSDPATDPATDAALARAMTNHGRVVLAADTAPASYDARLVAMRRVTPPTPVLLGAAGEVGSAEMRPSADFVVRQHFHGSRDDVLPSLSWAAARAVGAETAREEERRFEDRWVNYYGPAGTLPGISYDRALEPDVPAELFRGKVVFVGARLLTKFAGERKDEFRTPFSYWNPGQLFMSGVEVQATLFLNLARGDWLRRWPWGVERILIVLAGALLGWGFVSLRPWTATGLAFGLALLTTLAAYGLFAAGRTWFPWLIIVVQIGAALLYAVVYNSFRLYLQKKLYEQTLALYLSPKLVGKFSSNPKFLKPGAEKQLLTILFTDIANFTSISEGLDSDDLARAMNEYFQRAVHGCVHPQDGTVVKYIGDAIFAFWNAPEAQPDHAWRACQAALAFQRQEPQSLNGRPLITRLGLHTGVANVGNFGSTARVDYTALGESINLASRMEGLNKYLGTTVLATGETHREVAEKLVSRCAGRFRLKGFEKVVEVFELVDLPEREAESRPWREAFAEALARFRQRDFTGAEAGFRRVLELHPDDGPAKFYLAHLPEFLAHPPPEDWSGEVELKEK
jgi:adenylate cyclase